MVFPVVGGTQLTGDFVTNSLRLNDDDSPYLERSLSSPNTDKFTVSCWVKLCGGRSQIANIGKRLTGEAGDNRSIDIQQDELSNGRLGINAYNGVADSNVAAYNSNTGQGPLIRDSSAWYHFVYAFDTGQGTAGNRFKWYINGVLQSGYNTTTTPSQNADLFDSSGSGFRIGRAYNNESRYADMYVAEYYYVDGQQYDHTYFGEFNDNGVWVPVENGKGAGGTITFGTNGFYLQFKETGTSANASGIGADTSGNDNHLTPTNLAAVDITTDTPQNNFCTFNSLYASNTQTNGYVTTLSEGNLRAVSTTDGKSSGISSIGVANGKWYAEFKQIAFSSSNGKNYSLLGVHSDITPMIHNNPNGNGVLGYSPHGYAYWAFNSDGSTAGYKMNDDSSSNYGDKWEANDIIGLAIDLDNGAMYVSKNGTWQASSDPESGASKTNAIYALPAASTKPDGFYFMVVGDSGSSQTATWEANFGNAPFSISSGNSDGAGHGNFEYAVPSGYFALCTKNLAEYG